VAVPYESLPAYGVSAQLAEQRQQLDEDLSAMRERLALAILSSADHGGMTRYRPSTLIGSTEPRVSEAGMEILRSYVRACRPSNSAALVSLCLRHSYPAIKPKRLRHAQ